jgi:hypothetical protein
LKQNHEHLGKKDLTVFYIKGKFNPTTGHESSDGE